MQKISILVKFDQDMLDWLGTEAKRRRIPRAQVIRELVLREMEAQKVSE